MTSAELLRQFYRLQARNLPGWRSDNECEKMARDWHLKFAHIDADICEQEMSMELGRPDFPSVGRVHARCLNPQGDRDYYAKRRAEPEPERPDPMVGRVYIRAARIRLDEPGLSVSDSEARARTEIEAEMAEGSE